MSALDNKTYMVEESDSDDDIKSVGPMEEDSDEDLLVEDNDYTVGEAIGYDMKAKNVATEIKNRNKQMHYGKADRDVTELNESSDEDLKDSDYENSGSDSDFSADGLELLQDMPKPNKNGKITLVLDGGNGEVNEDECCEDDEKVDNSDCEEKCSDNESENDEWLEGKNSSDNENDIDEKSEENKEEEEEEKEEEETEINESENDGMEVD